MKDCNACSKYIYGFISKDGKSELIDSNIRLSWSSGGSMTGGSLKYYLKHEYITAPFVIGASIILYDSTNTVVYDGVVNKVKRFLYPNEEGVELFFDSFSSRISKKIVDSFEFCGDISDHLARIVSFTDGILSYTPAPIGITTCYKYDYQTCQTALNDIIKLLNDEYTVIIDNDGVIQVITDTTATRHILAIGSEIKDLELFEDASSLCNRLVVKWTEEVLRVSSTVLINPNSLPIFDTQGGTVYPCPVTLGEQWWLADNTGTLQSLVSSMTCPRFASDFIVIPATTTPTYSYTEEARVSIYDDLASQSVYGICECVVEVSKSNQTYVDALAEATFDRGSITRINGSITIFCYEMVKPGDLVTIVNHNALHNIYTPYLRATSIDYDGYFQTIQLNTPDDFVTEFRRTI